MGNNIYFCFQEEVIEPHYLRILIVGDSGVGKTSLINQVCYSKYQNHTTMTQCHQSHTYVSTPELKVFLIDTGGASQYKSCLAPSTVAKADAIIYVYDQSEGSSFRGVQRWQDHIEHLLSQSSIFALTPKQYLIANKEDKAPKNNTILSKNSSVSQDVNFQLSFSTSALSKSSLDGVISSIVEDIQKKQKWSIGKSLLRDFILKKVQNSHDSLEQTKDEDLMLFINS